MEKYLKHFYAVILAVVVFGLGCWLTFRYMTTPKSKIEEQATVLLEKVQTVAKLVSVEGHFSEIYTFRDEYEPLPNPIYSPVFSKQIITTVNARVSIGYDMEKMQMEADQTNKVLRISNIPDPEIISLEHDLKYYDLEESTFNSFKKDELTLINAQAKAFIRKKALESDLLLKAEEEGIKMLDLIRFMVEQAGWTVELQYAADLEGLEVEEPEETDVELAPLTPDTD